MGVNRGIPIEEFVEGFYSGLSLSAQWELERQMTY
jgi:hypothetical protein